MSLLSVRFSSCMYPSMYVHIGFRIGRDYQHFGALDSNASLVPRPRLAVQALPSFPSLAVLQAMGSWAGPGNEATVSELEEGGHDVTM